MPYTQHVVANFKRMIFNKEKYLEEMKFMVEKAINKIRKEKSDFEIYTVAIWTDPGAAASSIGFDSKLNSDNQIQKVNNWNKDHYNKLKEQGELEQARLFEQVETRNCNPAGFELNDFVEIENSTIDTNWEEESNGNCWNELEPALKEIGEYSFRKMKELNIHADFELAVNGQEDWYEFVWKEN